MRIEVWNVSCPTSLKAIKLHQLNFTISNCSYRLISKTRCSYILYANQESLPEGSICFRLHRCSRSKFWSERCSFFLFLVTIIKRYSLSKILVKRNFYTADINLNYFGLVIPKKLKDGFPVMAEVTRILAANIRRQFFFFITTTASTHCLVQNFQLICCSQWISATSQCNNSGSSRYSNGRTIGWLQWWNIAGSLCKEEKAAEKDD